MHIKLVIYHFLNTN